MKVSEFDYYLPDSLIAQFPLQQRTSSRLLHMETSGRLQDKKMEDMLDVLQKGDLLVLNDTKVIPARLYGKKETGGRVEILLERVASERTFLAQIKSSKSPKEGQAIFVEDTQCETVKLVMQGRQGSFFLLQVEQNINLLDWFDRVGHMPLPPYIERADQAQDTERYQTVFAKHQGAVAAPTAGLHYDEVLLQNIRDKGAEIATITLHVGAGTYQPVRVDSIEGHVMHSEWIEVNQSVCAKINATKCNGGRVVAVGTTVVRSLETAAKHSRSSMIEPFSGETDIFIYPGYQFEVVDMLQTNFHLPQSTLLMLVSAFAGKENIMQAYQHAIAEKYRFFSYGDAMLLHLLP